MKNSDYSAKNYVSRGIDVQIDPNCIFDKMKSYSKQGKIRFGDYCHIHENCRFFVDEEFDIGDYGEIQNNTLAYGYNSCKIGHNAWIGQNSIINFQSSIKIGNNFGIGTSSKVWTHAYFGDILEGCRLVVGTPDFQSKSGGIVIGDDFWGVGQITISPGVKIGNKVIALTNSLIIRDIPDNTIVAGIPAKPISLEGDFKAFKENSPEEKYTLMQKFATQFCKIYQITIKCEDKSKTIILGNNDIVISAESPLLENNSETTFFDLVRRTYTKKHNPLEKLFMKLSR